MVNKCEQAFFSIYTLLSPKTLKRRFQHFTPKLARKKITPLWAKFTTLKNIGKKNYPTQQLAYLRAGTGQCEFVIPASWEVPTPKVGHSPSTTASGYPVVRSLQKQGYYGLLVFRLPTLWRCQCLLRDLMFNSWEISLVPRRVYSLTTNFTSQTKRCFSLK